MSLNTNRHERVKKNAREFSSRRLECGDLFALTFRERHNVVSVYHEFHAEKYGKESRHSLFLLKNKARPYHIDYILVPQAWMRRVTAVSIGDHSRKKVWVPGAGRRNARLNIYFKLSIHIILVWGGKHNRESFTARQRRIPVARSKNSYTRKPCRSRSC